MSIAVIIAVIITSITTIATVSIVPITSISIAIVPTGILGHRPSIVPSITATATPTIAAPSVTTTTPIIPSVPTMSHIIHHGLHCILSPAALSGIMPAHNEYIIPTTVITRHKQESASILLNGT
mmetsp:Transcript_62635/g.111666  ORF Transcript_62635/g.111666 Transcript_62635/m.111666 type:complete len:124 (-) Transcript_62635:1607-1978(-)